MRTLAANPDPVDIHVGSRVRLRRTLLGMSQDKLGKALKLTFQQVQKYERGTNRIGASRLYQISRILDVPVSFFFDDMPVDTSQREQGVGEPEREPFRQEDLTRRESLELVRAYYQIRSPEVRKRIFDLVKAAAASDI